MYGRLPEAANAEREDRQSATKSSKEIRLVSMSRVTLLVIFVLLSVAVDLRSGDLLVESASEPRVVVRHRYIIRLLRVGCATVRHVTPLCGMMTHENDTLSQLRTLETAGDPEARERTVLKHWPHGYRMDSVGLTCG